MSIENDSPVYLGEVEHIYALVSVNADGEGIVGFDMLPVVGNSPAMLEWIKKMAPIISERNSKKLKLVKFSNKEILQEWGEE